MIYRDDLGAAVSRADALQRQLDETMDRAEADKARLAALERNLDAAQRELGRLRRRHPGPAPARPSSLLVVVAVSFALILLAGAGAFLATSPVGERPPVIFVQGEVRGGSDVAVIAPAKPPTLMVESTPHGGLVEIDGALVGRTPLTVELARGSHQVSVHYGAREQAQHVDLDRDLGLHLDFSRLGPVEIRKAMGDSRARLARCDAGGGRFDVTMRIAPDGTVVSARVASASDRAEARAARCIEKLVRTTRFPRARQATDVVYPLVLARGS